MKKISIKTMAVAGLLTALICVMGPFSVPLPFTPIPLSLTMLAIFFALFVIGMKLGTLCTFLYLLIGLVGMPVFSNFSGGAGKLLGPTGGYLIGFLFLAPIAGFFIDLGRKKKLPLNYIYAFVGMILGTVVCYAFGTVFFAFQTKRTILESLSLCVFPYIPGDIVKMVIASIVGPIVRKALMKANLI